MKNTKTKKSKVKETLIKADWAILAYEALAKYLEAHATIKEVEVL